MLKAGARLGPYEITGSLGAGGLGVVYKARDTRLNRMVAIKVLPADKVAHSDRKRRFMRERPEKAPPHSECHWTT